MIPVLRQYQKRGNEEVVAAARQGARVIVLQGPTGSGKTNSACDLIARAAAKESNVLAVVHRRQLVDQFSDRLWDFHVDHGILMRGHRREKYCPIQVASRDTLLSRCVHREFYTLPSAQLVVVDEGRHAVAPQFKAILDHYREKGAVIVLLDATPVLADGSGLGPWAEKLVVTAKVSELIDEGHILPVQCYAPDRKKTKRRGVAGDLVESWKSYAEDLPTVLFCSRIQHSLNAVKAFNDAGVSAVHLDADTKDKDRDAAYKGLGDGTVKVISNVGIVGEGVDLPCLGCCQFYMDPQSRTRFLQGCGRIMRPAPNKSHGVLIDHAGAVFRHGFPDEDTEWTLLGNVDENYARRRQAGLAPSVRYCADCERLYHGALACPQCGALPQQPPRSLFKAPPVAQENELLIEAERGGEKVYAREEKVKHWFRCLGVAKARDQTFGSAAQIYKRKYGVFPPEDFPCIPERDQWKKKVREVFPNFGRRGG